MVCEAEKLRSFRKNHHPRSALTRSPSFSSSLLFSSCLPSGLGFVSTGWIRNRARWDTTTTDHTTPHHTTRRDATRRDAIRTHQTPPPRERKRNNTGLSVHTVLWSIYHLWGAAALPADTPGVYGAHGTNTSCTIQGFLLQISTTLLYYYVLLSCYSWVVIVQGNFDPARYEWIEKYIHFGVHVFPVASAVVLLRMEAFNAHGQICWIASVPAGCGTPSGTECAHGPQHPERVLLFSAGLPSCVILAFPTAAMVALVGAVYLRSRNGNIPPVITASMVAKQSALYLGCLYWVYLPLVLYYGGGPSFRSFGVAVWVSTVSFSLGLWFALVYRYFSTSGKEPSAFSRDDLSCGGCAEGTAGKGHRHRSTDRFTEPYDLPEGPASSLHPEDDDDGDRNCSAIIEEEGVLNDLRDPSDQISDRPGRSEKRLIRNCSNRSRNNNNNNNNNNNIGGDGNISQHHKARDGSGKSLRSRSGGGGSKWSLNESSQGSRERFSFNIFDGTASSGKFAAFVFDGDSDDEEADMAETRRWAGCQTIISDR